MEMEMTKNVKFWCITYILTALSLINGVHSTTNPSAPSKPPAPACSDLIYDMIDCVTFLENGQSDPKPSPSCCAGFETVLDTDADCVCEGLKGAADMGLDINITKAGTLPSFCHVSGPSISSCLSTSPVPSPGPSPATPPATSPPTTHPPKSNPPATNPPESSPPRSHNTPPPKATPSTPSAPSTSPSSGSPGEDSPAPSPSSHKSSGNSIMPMILVSFIVIVATFLTV